VFFCAEPGRAAAIFGKGARVLKVILINVRNALILLALVYFSIPVVTTVSSLLEQWFPEPDKRAKLVNYKDDPWAEQYFNEYRELKMDYAGYVGWRRKPFSGRTITIDAAQGIRVTPPVPGLSGGPTYFFGGSTMWGEGSRDDMTIPAYYQGFARETAVNYGQSGWTAHQSLNQLMQLLEGGQRPANVVFYDGFNEVANKCRRENNFFSHLNERQIRDAVEYKPTQFGYYWRTLKDAGKAVVTAILGPKQEKNKKFYDCDTDPQKAERVAGALISDWKMARYIAEDNGARFFAFLQPVAFLSKTRLSQVEPGEKDAEVGKQFEALYPLIRAKMKDNSIGIDLSGALDYDDYIYIGTSHVSPNGNRLVAEGIWKAMSMSVQSSAVQR
jgi:hypothetical protein